MTIARLRVTLSGAGVVGPGLMTFYSRNLTPPLPGSVLKFINALLPGLAGGVVFNVPNGGDTIDEVTGQLTGGWTGSGGGTATAPTAPVYALGNGGLVNWATDAVYGGHKVVGRTFVVPVGDGTLDNTGHLTAAVVSGWTAAGTTLISDMGGDLVIWSRPRKAGSGKMHNLPARAGAAFPVTRATVPNIPTSLRSRRT